MLILIHFFDTCTLCFNTLSTTTASMNHNGEGYCRAGLESLVSFRALNLNRTAASAYALAAGLLDTIPDANRLVSEYQNGEKPSHMLEAILKAKDKTFVLSCLCFFLSLFFFFCCWSRV
jgi:hypothetical protein